MFEFIEVKKDHDVDKVARLAEIIWNEYYLPIVGKEQIAYMLKKFQSKDPISEQIKDGTRYFIVRSDGAELGYFALKPEENGMFLSKLYILDWARGKGVGRCCLEYIREMCLSLGRTALYLTVNRNNEDSIAAYKAFGFQIDRQQRVSIGGGFFMDDYIMSIAL